MIGVYVSDSAGEFVLLTLVQFFSSRVVVNAISVFFHIVHFLLTDY